MRVKFVIAIKPVQLKKMPAESGQLGIFLVKKMAFFKANLVPEDGFLNKNQTHHRSPNFSSSFQTSNSFKHFYLRKGQTGAL